MTADKSTRIAWLAELSAARRVLRESGWTAREAIDAQLATRRIVRFSVYSMAEYRRAVLSALYVLQDGRCYLCDRRMLASSPRDPDGATRDHVTPRIRGGRDGENLLAAHRSCNELKADRAPTPCELLYLAAVNAQRRSSPRQRRETQRPDGPIPAT